MENLRTVDPHNISGPSSYDSNKENIEKIEEYVSDFVDDIQADQQLCIPQKPQPTHSLRSSPRDCPIIETSHNNNDIKCADTYVFPNAASKQQQKKTVAAAVPKTPPTQTTSIDNNSKKNYVLPTDTDYPIQITGGGRKKSNYKPVHHAPTSRATTSFFHIFRFADASDYLLIAFAIFFSISNGIIIPLMTQLLGNLFDVFIEQQNHVITKPVFQEKISYYALSFVGLGAASFGLTAFMTFFWMLTGERQTRRMKEVYFQSLLRMDIAWFERDEVTSGGLLTSLNRDAEDIQNVISGNLGLVIQYLATAIGCIAIAFYNNWLLTLVITIALPLMLVVLAYTSRAAAPLINKERSIFLVAGNILEYTLSAIKTVKSFNGENKEETRHLSCLQEVDSVSSKLARTFALRNGWIQFLLLSLFVQGFWFGSTLVVNKKLSPGGVLSVFYACLLAVSVIRGVLPLLNYFQRAKNAIRAINELLRKVTILDIEALRGFKLSKCEGNIEFQLVSFAYPGRPDTTVLRNVDILIPAGKTTVLVGQSGSGKSTVAQLIQRLYDPEEGLITLDGRDIRILNTQWLRQQIGVVSQELVLFDDTIFKNVAYGRADYWCVTYSEVVAACRIACIHDFILGLRDKYQTRLGDKGEQLSGGQRQRLAIARALIRDPAILILDEASSALDVTSDREVQEALDNCRKNRTTVVITHKLSHVKDTDLVYLLDKGEVVERGTRSELLSKKSGHFYKLAQQDNTNPKRRTRESHLIDLKLRRNSTISKKRENAKYLDVDLSASAGLLKRSFSMATRVGWRESAYEDYFDKNAMDVLRNTASASVTKRHENRLSYFGILSYYDEDDDKENLVDIVLSNPDEQTNEKGDDQIKFLQLMKTTMENKFMYFSGLIAALANGFVMPAFSVVFSQLLAAYSLPDKQLKIRTRELSLLVLLIAIANGLTAHLKYFLLERASERWSIRLRHKGFGILLRQPQAFFEKPENATGRLTTTLISNTDIAKNLVGHFVGSMIFVMVTLLAGIIWAFVVGWQLALVGFGFVPLVLLAAELQGFILQKYEKKRKAYSEDAANAFYQTISRIRTVFSLSVENAMRNKFNAALRKPCEIGFRKAFVCALCSGLTEALGYFIKAITFYYGAHLVSEGTYNLQRMLTVWTLVIFCTTSVSAIFSDVPYYAKSKQAIKALCKILSLPQPSTGGMKLDKVQGTVTFKNVFFDYQQRPDPVLQGLNLNIMAGETVAFVGKSGSGKSTVAALLQRLYDPKSGAIMLDYNNIQEMDLHWLREQIGIVSQEPVLFDMTIAENIAYGKDNATQEEIKLVAKKINVHDFVLTLPGGYETKLGSGGSQLSGGQKQRIAIARVLLRNPKVLILDEATSALDSANEAIVQEALQKIKKGRTTLMITHQLNSAQQADKIAFIDNGCVEEFGTHKELMALRGGYWMLVNSAKNPVGGT